MQSETPRRISTARRDGPARLGVGEGQAVWGQSGIPHALVSAEFAILDCNAPWREVLSLGPGETLRERLADPDWEAWRAPLAQALAAQPVKAERLRLSGPDGADTWLHVHFTPWRDGADAVAGVLIAAIDVTDLVLQLGVARRSERRLEAAVRLAKVRVFEVDYRHRTIEFGGAERQGLAVPMTFETYAANRWERVHSLDRERVIAEEEAARAAGKTAVLEYRHHRSAEVWLETAAQDVFDADGALERTLLISRDVTDRKTAELALQDAKAAAETASHAKSQLLATVSHEIRTPLNGVLGMAQAMAAGPLAGEQRERLEVIEQSGASLLEILNDILDMSKIEAGKLTLELIPFDLAPVLQGVRALYQSTADKRGLAFDVQMADAEGVYLGDPTRVRQILCNLVSNALKFTRSGGVSITARRTGADLWFEVADTGIGMSSEATSRLFEAYAQAEDSTARQFGGTGLGLTICRQLCDLMAGEIGVRSAPGEGTCFTVRLSIPWQGDVAEPADADDAPQDPAGRPPLRVLAAEDNAVNRLVLATLLEQAGVQVVLTENGREALEAWQAADWDVILMDVRMPIMDGIAATREIRAQEQASGRARTPIIALTADTMSHQVSAFLADGFDAHVAKPIQAARLLASLEAVLAAQEASVAAGVATLPTTPPSGQSDAA